MAELTKLEMEVPTLGNGFEFTAHGSARWETRRLDVDFRVHLRADGRLFVTQLSLDAREQPDEVNGTALRTFPIGELMVMVRQWVAAGGQPNGVVARMLRQRGEEPPGADVWSRARNGFVAALAGPCSRDGGKVGRPPISDLDLREFAEQYLMADRSGERAPRQVVARAIGLTEGGVGRRAQAARKRGWLAPVTGKGVRRQIAPGPRLFTAWEAEGYPEWWNDQHADDKEGRRDER